MGFTANWGGFEPDNDDENEWGNREPEYDKWEPEYDTWEPERDGEDALGGFVLRIDEIEDPDERDIIAGAVELIGEIDRGMDSQRGVYNGAMTNGNGREPVDAAKKLFMLNGLKDRIKKKFNILDLEDPRDLGGLLQ